MEYIRSSTLNCSVTFSFYLKTVQPVGALSKPSLGADVAILQPAGKPGDNSSRQAHLEGVGLHQWEKETMCKGLLGEREVKINTMGLLGLMAS